MHTIAIVDDYADTRVLLRETLGDLYDIEEYASGPEALEGLSRAVPALVLLDISLPGMDGVEVLGRIRADVRLKHLPVIALSAHGREEDRDRYIELGFSEYLHMPILDEKVLRAEISRWLSTANAKS